MNILWVQVDVVFFDFMMSCVRSDEFSVFFRWSETSIVVIVPPLTHQRNSARRRHLVELLLIQREGMSELSHDRCYALIGNCSKESMLLRREGRIEMKMLETQGEGGWWFMSLRCSLIWPNQTLHAPSIGSPFRAHQKQRRT